MRILSAESLAEMIEKYANASHEDHLVGNIVLSNSQKRKDLRLELSKNAAINQARMCGLVLSFNSGSLIRLSIAAERPGNLMFDDILVDEEINDFELLLLLDRREYFKELIDFGEFSPTQELSDYISTLAGAC